MTPEALQRVLKLDNGWALQKQLLPQRVARARGRHGARPRQGGGVGDAAHDVRGAAAPAREARQAFRQGHQGAQATRPTPRCARTCASSSTTGTTRPQLPEDNYWQTLEKLIAEPGKERGRARHVRRAPRARAAAESGDRALRRDGQARRGGDGEARDDRAAARAGGWDAGDNKVVWTLRRHLDNTGTIRRLLRDRPIDFEVLFRLVSRVGFPAAGALLDALEIEDDRTARWKLFEMLAQLGPKVGDAVVARLPKAPWFVQRNLLLLMGAAPRLARGLHPAPYAQHAGSARAARGLRAAAQRSEDARPGDRARRGGRRRAHRARGAQRGRSSAAARATRCRCSPQRLTAHSLDGMLGVLAVRCSRPCVCRRCSSASSKRRSRPSAASVRAASSRPRAGRRSPRSRRSPRRGSPSRRA